MTTTVSHDSATFAQRATNFTAQVRANLGDLPAEELDDLLDGLGADLEERLADGGELDDPAQYAEELRQAAGLPPRSDTPDAKPRRTLGERAQAAQAASAAWFDATPGRRSFRDFAVTLRPVWWIARAALITWFVLIIFGHPLVAGFAVSFPALLLFAGLATLSVQWGRGKWLPKNWLRHLRTLANCAAVLLLLPLTAVGWSGLTSQPAPYIETGPEYAPGLQANGEQVLNIFAYDCEGNPLSNVRLYDQNGNPLETTIGDPWAGGTEVMAPEYWDEDLQQSRVFTFNPLAADAEAWNVFPLTSAVRNDSTGKLGTPEIVTPKKSELPPLTRDCAAEDTEADGASAESDEAGTDAEPGSRRSGAGTDATDATDAADVTAG